MLQSKIQGESLARGPKLLSMYTVEQRGFLVRKYWQTGSFKACQTAFRTEFGERSAPSKCSVQKLVKKLETRGSRSNACPLPFFWGGGAYWRAKFKKNTPRTIEQIKDALRQEIEAVNVDILGNVFQNLEKRIQLCLDMKGDQFQYRLWAGPVLHLSRYVYINFQVNYLNNIIFYRQYIGSSNERLSLYIAQIVTMRTNLEMELRRLSRYSEEATDWAVQES